MSKDFFFTPSNLDESENIALATKEFTDQSEVEKVLNPNAKAEGLFTSTDLGGRRQRNVRSDNFKHTHIDEPAFGVPAEMSDELRKELTDKLLSNSSAGVVKNIAVDSSRDCVIVRFIAPDKKIACDIELPLDITANDLVVGLNEAYKLGIDISDMRQCYLSCENPLALLKGKRLLGEFGIRDGSLIAYYR